jgi:DNA-binding PadR family transcriptional regulator
MNPHSKQYLQIEGALLGLLAETPMHGYDLFKTLQQPGGLSLVWHIKQSNLYAILDKLEKQGYLSTEFVADENSHPRKDFHVTPSGQVFFQNWMCEPVHRGRDMRQIFLAKLYFALKNNQETARRLVNEQYKFVVQWKKEIKSKMETLNRNQKYEHLVLKFRLFQVNAWMELLDKYKIDFESNT